MSMMWWNNLFHPTSVAHCSGVSVNRQYQEHLSTHVKQRRFYAPQTTTTTQSEGSKQQRGGGAHNCSLLPHTHITQPHSHVHLLATSTQRAKKTTQSEGSSELTTVYLCSLSPVATHTHCPTSTCSPHQHNGQQNDTK